VRSAVAALRDDSGLPRGLDAAAAGDVPELLGRPPARQPHRQHVKYPSRGVCPASHSVAPPTIVLIVLYPPVPRGSQVASGKFAAHADFMNGWDQTELERLVRERSLRR
jgi:hypothetical protein